MKAKFFLNKNNSVECFLCPHNCRIEENKVGICRVRKNENGVLISKNYGKLSGIHLDPIEKKPLYHYYPGSYIFSIGSFGCNFRCRWCQNWQISQTNIEDFYDEKTYTPEIVIKMALSYKENIGIAYTYNEPFVWYEFMYDTAVLAKKNNLKNVVVTNGYVNEEPLIELIPFIDACNVDLKSFNDNIYKKLIGGSLEPVLKTLLTLRKYNVYFEITNLIVPGANDNEEEFKSMIIWIAENLGKSTVLHLSKYYPMYKYDEPSTSPELIEKFYRIAKEYLYFVYVGNIQLKNYQDTYCYKCGNLVLRRSGYLLSNLNFDNEGKCTKCGEKIFIM